MTGPTPTPQLAPNPQLVSRLILASGNPDKAAALQHQIGDLVPILLPNDLPHDGIAAASPPPPEAPEDAPTLQAIAETKALHCSRLYPCETIVATDGGLLIPALGSAWDPRRTRRFAGPTATDQERIVALLALTAHFAGPDRRVGWREALVVARAGTLLASWEAESPPGLLAHKPCPAPLAPDRFWLPLLWRCPEFDNRYLAALTPTEQAARPDHWTLLAHHLRQFLTTSG